MDKVDRFAVQLSNSRVAPALPSSVWGRLGSLLPGSRPAHLRENPRFNRPLLGFDLTTHRAPVQDENASKSRRSFAKHTLCSGVIMLNYCGVTRQAV